MIPTRFTSHESPLKKRLGRRNVVHAANVLPMSSSSSSGSGLIIGTTEEAAPREDRPDITGSALEEDLASTNPYITFVAKRIRKLRKRVARIESNESILNSDPDARSKMEPAQLDAVVRKLDAVAPLRELEDILKLMTDRHEKDKKDEAADQLKKQTEAKKTQKSVEEQMPLNSSVECFIQIVKLFYVLKQLEDAAEFLDNGLLKSLKVLDAFRSKLFLAAEVAELGDDERRQQWLYDMVMDMVNRSSKPTSDDDSRTFCEVITELDNIVHPNARECHGSGVDPEGAAIHQTEATPSDATPSPDLHACRDVENWLVEHQKRSVEGLVPFRSPLATPQDSALLPYSAVKDRPSSPHDIMEAHSDILKHQDDLSQKYRSLVHQERYRTQRPIPADKQVLVAGATNETRHLSSLPEVIQKDIASSASVDGTNVTTPGPHLGGSSEMNSAGGNTTRSSTRAGGVPEHQVLSMPLLQYPHPPQLLLPPLSSQMSRQQQSGALDRAEQHYPAGYSETQLDDAMMRHQYASHRLSQWMDQQPQQQQHQLNHFGHSHPYHQAPHPGQQSFLQQTHQFYQPPPFFFGYHSGFDSANPHGVGFDEMMDDGTVGGGMAGVWIEPMQAQAGRTEEVTGSQTRTKWGKGASRHRHKSKAKPKSDL